MLVLLLALVWTQPAFGWLFFSKCFDELPEEFNCFDVKTPYTNTMLFTPRSPTDQNIRFYHFTPSSPTQPQELFADAAPPSGFDANGKVACFIHGFTSASDNEEFAPMVAALLRKVDHVIMVDWSDGAKGPNYYRAAANTRVVGARVAQLIKSLGVDPARVHLIGHSLGAHAAGYAGEKFGNPHYNFHPTNIGRITGLDPAGPGFENKDVRVRLDPDDATFVDVLHTDAEHLARGGLGMKIPCGDVDFMPNGGHDMPGCPATILNMDSLMKPSGIVEKVSCSHGMAVVYFTASIDDGARFPACPCSLEELESDSYFTHCDPGYTCMGYHADPARKGVFVLDTGIVEL